MIPRDLPTFLRRAYRYKEISDYGTGTEDAVTMADAETALTSAAAFVRQVRAAVE